MKDEKEKVARTNLLRNSSEITGLKIEGCDFNEGVGYDKIVSSFKSTGFQATQLSRAIEITNKMIDENAFIFLGYTSNMISSGLREVIRYLAQHKKVNVLVTTCGGIEEDIIKCLGDFVLGNFDADGKELREKGINRIGNIFVPNSRYVAFEKFVQPILEELYNEKKIISGSELIWKLGEKINDKRSICYWAWKNKIKIYCPALLDGALGDNIYFFKFKHDDVKNSLEHGILEHPKNQNHMKGFFDFKIDVTDDLKWFNDLTIGLKKSGVIILGSGVVKHSILNANMLRNGADYAVYINTAQEFDGSDAGALPSEAVSWGKITGNAESVKVFADATIVFPILVAETFAKR